MRHVLIFCLLVILALAGHAQSPCEPEFEVIRADIDARRYQSAITKLLIVQKECPGDGDQVGEMIQETFALIEGERDRADSALAASEQERNRADSALVVANRVLDQMYFYEGKFGLTLKEVNYEYLYGFIDRNGRVVIPFLFEEASPFSNSDGFARVSTKGIKYLLDTTGITYRLAESWDEMREETEALHLKENLSDSIGKYSGLEVVLFIDELGTIEALPQSIGNLEQLKHLAISYSNLSQLPKSFSRLQRLESLFLRSNQFKEFPIEITQLGQLQTLDFSNNELREIPREITQMRQLQTLDFSGNELAEIPSEITQLIQLKSLNLRSNPLLKLPKNIGQLQHLETLNLNYTYLPQNDLDSLQKILPKCHIIFLSQEERLNFYQKKAEDLKRICSRRERQLRFMSLEILKSQAASDYCNLGWFQLLTGQFIEAEVALNRGIELDSTNNYLYTRLPLSLLMQGNTETARKFYQQWSTKLFSYKTYKEICLNDLQAIEGIGVIPLERKEAINEIRKLLQKD